MRLHSLMKSRYWQHIIFKNFSRNGNFLCFNNIQNTHCAQEGHNEDLLVNIQGNFQESPNFRMTGPSRISAESNVFSPSAKPFSAAKLQNTALLTLDNLNITIPFFSHPHSSNIDNPSTTITQRISLYEPPRSCNLKSVINSDVPTSRLPIPVRITQRDKKHYD